MVYAGQDHLVGRLNLVRLELEEFVQMLWWSVTGMAGGLTDGIDWPTLPIGS